jgi:hypothetical protein
MAKPTLWILPKGNECAFKYPKKHIQADSNLDDLGSSFVFDSLWVEKHLVTGTLSKDEQEFRSLYV